MRYFIYAAVFNSPHPEGKAHHTRNFGRHSNDFPSNDELIKFVADTQKGEEVVILSICEVSEADYKTFWGTQLDMPKPATPAPKPVAFDIDGDDLIELNAWKEKIKAKYGEYGHYDYTFSPMGIGTGIKVYSHLLGETLDLSHPEKW